MILFLAAALVFLAALLFFARQRHRRRAALPAGTLLSADNLEKPCPLLVSTRYGLKGKPGGDNRKRVSPH